MINNAPLTSLKGVGEKTAALFARLHITNTRELLEHYPRGYEFMEPLTCAANLTSGKVCALRARVQRLSVNEKGRSLKITTVEAGDGTGLFRMTFFNMPYLKSILKPGSIHVFRGMCQENTASPAGSRGAFEAGGGAAAALGAAGRPAARIRMEQPRIYRPEEYLAIQGTYQPRYSLTAGLSNNQLLKAVRTALEEVCGDSLPEFLPDDICTCLGLITQAQALRYIHCPRSMEEIGEARKRLAFQEFFAFFLGLHRMKGEHLARPVSHPLHTVPDTERLLSLLPYRLTGAQLRVWKEIEADLTGQTAMNRLVQGDVGSGKTILAFLALLLCASCGRQGCLMAPTEVLANQHYEALCRLNAEHSLGLSPVLLTGSQTAREKRELYRKIREGEANVIIGTHALIQEKVEYQELALVVTDEQHRFGVRQRETLADKGADTHVLVMSATPIPRTLAIVLYGDLNVSILDEMPAGRKRIRSCVVGTSYRPTAYRFLAGQVEQGHQIYCICPMVEEGEMDELENVIDYADKLRSALPSHIRVESLHGRMKPAQKAQIMEDFAAGKTDILVSTTVIEVGINVPNATVMLVENAERFGLAQLHQLRGRVGRGDAQSYCIFISSNDSEQTMKRLKILNDSNDGFQIASEDLKLRGPGDLFGIRQSGELAFKVGDIYQDSGLLLTASSLAERIVAEDPEKKRPDYAPLYRWEEENGRLMDLRSL